ncbi:MAG: transcription antitermination factor NusB [Chloroflexota bacterium]
MSPRRRARMLAIQALFELDFQQRDPDEILAERLEETDLSQDNQRFVRALVLGVLKHVEEIDASIGRAAPQWPVDQIAHVDKNVLRLAIYELMFDNSAPAKVAISEAIELARLFGSAASSKFVNGVLGAIVVRSDRSSPPAESISR